MKHPKVNKPFVWPLDAHGFDGVAYAEGRHRARIDGMIPATMPDGWTLTWNQWRWFLAGCHDALPQVAREVA